MILVKQPSQDCCWKQACLIKYLLGDGRGRRTESDVEDGEFSLNWHREICATPAGTGPTRTHWKSSPRGRRRTWLALGSRSKSVSDVKTIKTQSWDWNSGLCDPVACVFFSPVLLAAGKLLRGLCLGIRWEGKEFRCPRCLHRAPRSSRRYKGTSKFHLSVDLFLECQLQAKWFLSGSTGSGAWAKGNT